MLNFFIQLKWLVIREELKREILRKDFIFKGRKKERFFFNLDMIPDKSGKFSPKNPDKSGAQFFSNI